ncbi:MAG: DUF454 domain-containing protein [bacterium]|nr:DUF454 domain-containing protein [bacterium]
MKWGLDRPLRRALYLVLGILFFATGVIGVFLPVLPTTPFMLLALWAFSNSSQTLHDYIWNHKKYGPMVRAWKQHGSIPLKAKISAIAAMGLSAVFVVLYSGAPNLAIISALTLMLMGATYILTRPTLRAAEIDKPGETDTNN